MVGGVRGLLRRLEQVRVGRTGAEAQQNIAAWLASERFSVQQEVPVPDRGDGHMGRVDLLARRGALTLAIEVDGPVPHRKSVVKLRQIPGAVRMVIVRGWDGRWPEPAPEGITAVVRVGLNGPPLWS
jgi:hypothetical protein